MNGASTPGGGTPGRPGGGTRQSSRSGDPRELWPRDFGRDGVSGLVTPDRALRARDVSRPDAEDERVALEVVAELLARVDGRRPSPPARSGQRAERDP